MVEVINEEPITVYEARKLIDEIEARDGELSFRSGKTKEYLSGFNALTAEQVALARKELEELALPRIRDVHVCKLLDILPLNEEDVKSVLHQFSITLKSEHLKKIVEVLDKHR